MHWYFLFSPYSTRSQTKQFCSIYSSFHGTWGHTQFEKRSRKPSVKCWNFTHDEWRKRQNKYTRLELNITVDAVGLLSIMHQVFIFILKCIVYAAFCCLIWLLQGWRSRKLVDDTAWTTQIWRVRFIRKDEMSSHAKINVWSHVWSQVWF